MRFADQIWFSFNEKKPEHNQDILFTRKKGKIEKAIFVEDKLNIRRTAYLECIDGDVIINKEMKWMEIPEVA